MFEQSRRRVVPLAGAVTGAQEVFAQRQAVATPSSALVDRTTVRGSELRRAVAALDATIDLAQRAALAAWIGEEYRLSYGAIPIGFVATCYLGPPYVDHYLNLVGQIVEHFSAGQRMPDPYESGRMLARSAAYEFIEIHSDGTLLPVKPDGMPVLHSGSAV